MDVNDGSESDVRSRISSSSRNERRRILRNGAENYRSSLMNDERYWDNEADLVQHKKSNQTKSLQTFKDSTWNNEDENSERSGPWNDPFKSRYSYENPMRDGSGIDGFSNAGDERDELLKKLDKTEDQLSRFGNLTRMGKEKAPLNTRMARPDPHASDNQYRDSSSGIYRVSNQYNGILDHEVDTGFRHMSGSIGSTSLGRFSSQYAYPDAQFKRPVYIEPSHLMHREEMDTDGFYPPRYGPNHGTQGYGDPLRSHMLRRGPLQNPVAYQEPRSHVYMSGPYIDVGMEPYPPNVRSYYPSYHDNPGSFGLRDHQISNPLPLGSHSHTRFPSDVNSEVDGFIRRRPPRVQLASGGKLCRPIAGGVPFLACYNCFDLLLLPKKILSTNNTRKKMKCGACSTLIVFTVSNKNLVLAITEEAMDTLVTNDYDNSDYDFDSIETDLGNLSVGHEMNSHHSAISSYAADMDEEHGNLIAAKQDSNSGDLEKTDKGSRFLVGSTLQHHFEYSNKYHKANQFGNGNRSGQGQDKELPNKTTTKRMLREESSATEIDLSSNEYCYNNTGTTFDSGEASREGDRWKGIRVAESFIPEITNSNRSNHTDEEEEKGNVTVNGHLITDRLIKKAEKMAGPIHPGNYWYDFRAGFWGVIGGHCLGIIPPFIQEFNYPMPENCGDGNSGVFVNGRELNEKDLKLLGSRGLPTGRDGAYIVEISGRVLDEDTGEELQSLGRLAPTVERVKHGFGMRDPKATRS